VNKLRPGLIAYSWFYFQLVSDFSHCRVGCS
jgi:hypothetical protein